MSSQQRFLMFLGKLERRIEFILLKSGFVVSGCQAKQLVLHGHISLNGIRISAYNYQLALYDLISVNDYFLVKYKDLLVCNFFKTAFFFNFLKKKRIIKKMTVNQLFVYFKFPSFLEINYKNLYVMTWSETKTSVRPNHDRHCINASTVVIVFGFSAGVSITMPE